MEWWKYAIVGMKNGYSPFYFTGLVPILSIWLPRYRTQHSLLLHVLERYHFPLTG
jgi:hypothetical protein